MLLICYLAKRLKVRPCTLTLEHLTADQILGFLDHLEADRNNSVGTRNVRLAAIKSFFVISNIVCRPISTWPGRFVPFR